MGRKKRLAWLVLAGSPFNVALKVTSGQPVRASPLRLSYDAKLLEPVNVRAGGFFAEGLSSLILQGAAGRAIVHD